MISETLLTNRESETVSSLWRRAVAEGEREARITLGPSLEEHLVLVLMSFVKETSLCRVVAREYLEQGTDIEALLKLAGRCLIITGFFPELALRRNVRSGYFFELGRGAYSAHANYWSARGKLSYARSSERAAERFLDLVGTLRGMKKSRLASEEIEALNVPRLGWN